MRFHLPRLLVALPLLAATAGAQSPRAAVDALLAADRGFARTAAGADLVTGLAAAFAPDVTVLLPRSGFAVGQAQALAAFRADTLNPRSRAEWTPLRGGVSADGQHGFTAGGMLVHRPDGTTVPYRYLAYWVRGAEGWRVAVYKRVRVERPTAGDTLPAALPARLVAPVADTVAIAAHRATLDRAERAFSSEAQQIGLGPAFARWGSADALNLGGPQTPGLVVGADAIGQLVGQGLPPNTSPFTWGPDRVLVASSGDLGVTIGMLTLNQPSPDPNRPSKVPFITIWRRADPSQPWRYVAE